MYSNIREHVVKCAHTAYTACPISSNRLHVLNIVDLSKWKKNCIMLGISCRTRGKLFFII